MLYGLGMVLVRYLWTRADLVTSAHHWGEQENAAWSRALWRAMRWTETAYKVGTVANFLAFLRYGQYRCAHHGHHHSQSVTPLPVDGYSNGTQAL